jgi:hypothetical protein
MKSKQFLPLLLSIIMLSGCQTNTPEIFPTITTNEQPQEILIQTHTLITATQMPTPSPTFTQTITPSSSETQPEIKFTFISETIPDGTRFNPGEQFRKTWSIKNNGTQSWDGFGLAVESSNPEGELLGSPAIISLPVTVTSGQLFEIKVDLTAPKVDGNYTVYYHLQNQNGMPVENTRIWVNIIVGNSASTSANNIYATYQSSDLQAGEFAVDFCMQIPDERQWYPWGVSLIVVGNHYQPSGSRIDPGGAITAYKCFSFSYPLQILSGTAFQLSIERVELPPEVHQAENCLRAQKNLKVSYPGLDFTCTGPGLFYTNLVLPAGMTKAEADRLILDAMSSTIYGPWILEGNYP